MRLSLLCLFLFCFATNLIAQPNSANTTNVTKFTILSPGISYEKSVGNNQTLQGHLYISTPVSYTFSNSFGGDFHVAFDPAFRLQYRYYYNYGQRQQKEKRTELNSLNYISTFLQTSLSKGSIAAAHPVEYKRRLIYNTCVVWGLQRN